MHATDALAEADRLMTICNSCRYCEGLCAVFPAMEIRRDFSDGDLNYLANLCHGCGACYTDCQFSPPHDFNVNVPQTLAVVRRQSYAAYAFPRALAPLFARNGWASGLIGAVSIAAFLIGFTAMDGSASLLHTPASSTGFYALMPHAWMAGLFGAVFVLALAALGLGLAAFWRDIGEPGATLVAPRPLWQAMRDAGRLRYLDGGGAGCVNADDVPSDARRRYHHFTFYGFGLCLAATSVATLYHYVLHREAPYPLWDVPVVLGTIGGLCLLIGPVGLYRAKLQRDPALADQGSTAMDLAFLACLFLAGLTGLALLGLRDTPLLGASLALHLGVVMALFITLPYGKFVHGIYRFAALVRSARERQAPI